MLRQGFSGCYCDHNLDVSYRKGLLMFMAGYAQPCISQEVKSLELVDHTEKLRVSPSRLTRIEQESAQDPVFTNLRQVILEGFFQFRDALIAQGNLVFRGHRLYVPSILRKEFMFIAHSRLRECMIWPGMSAQMKDFVG